ncbi:hypothetical protein DACRYDRAFT_82932, partial [Dacryopinax primogenitus]
MEALRTITPVSITSDLQWLWRTIYNTGVRGCSVWDDDAVSELFRHAILLMECCEKTLSNGADGYITVHKAIASFLVISGKVFLARGTKDAQVRLALHRQALQEIVVCKTRLNTALQQSTPGEEEARLGKMLQTCVVYEVEQLAYLGQWDPITRLIQETSLVPCTNMDALEMIADILWKNNHCPIGVVHAALEAILRTSLETDRLPMAKFCRWLRAVCDLLLQRGGPNDRQKTTHYFKQAIDVLQLWKDRADFSELYPTEERQWLFSTAHNAGIEDFRMSNVDGGRAWFAIARSLCAFVPGGDEYLRRLDTVQ